MNVPWILILIAVVVVIIAIFGILIYRKKGWKREVDYRSYFTMGIIWLPFGIIFYLIFDNMIGFWFTIMGLAYLLIGLKNKDKWGKPQQVSPKYQKIMMVIIALLVIAFILGILVFSMF